MSDVIQGEVVESNPIVRRGSDAGNSQLATGGATYQPIVPRLNVRVRLATKNDLPFIDRMQKAHSRELGFLPTAALEGKIGLGQVLLAERHDDERHEGTQDISRWRGNSRHEVSAEGSEGKVNSLD